MVRLEKSESLKRKIRKDAPAELAKPTWDAIAEAIKAGKKEEALELLDHVRYVESQMDNDSLVSFVEVVLTYLAEQLGEEKLGELFRRRQLPRVEEFIASTHGAEEVLQRITESQRRHHANFTVTEEPGRYVIKYDPCGSGGRLRRTRQVGLTKKAYPWSWGKANVPYYCSHCCVNWEILPIELQGYPTAITVVGETPKDPCVRYLYKNPESIPEEYFTKVGKKKDIARIKKGKK